MVFKTICVGSIPATLVIVFPNKNSKLRPNKLKLTPNTLKRLLSNGKSNYKTIRKILLEQTQLLRPVPYHTLSIKAPLLFKFMRFTKKLMLVTNQKPLYKRSRRLKYLRRKARARKFKFRYFIKFARKRKNISTADQPNRPILNYPIVKTPSISEKTTLKRAFNVQTLYKHTTSSTKNVFFDDTHLLKTSLRRRSSLYKMNLLYTTKINPWVTRTQLVSGIGLIRRRGPRLLKSAFSKKYKRLANYKNSNTTRAYKLDLDSKFSAVFTKAKRGTLRTAQQNYFINLNQSLVPTHTSFLISGDVLNQFITSSNYSNSFTNGNKHHGLELKSLSLTTCSYNKQLRNIFYNNYTKATDIVKLTKLTTSSAVEGVRYQYPNTISTPVSGDSTYTYAPQILENWTLELNFIRRKNMQSPNAVFILGRAPTYRMGINSTAPISTSQHNGNYFNSWVTLSSSDFKKMPLFIKAKTLSLTTKFNRPRWNTQTKTSLTSVYHNLKHSVSKKNNSEVQRLTHIQPTTLLLAHSDVSLSTDHPTKQIWNMRQYLVSSYKNRKRKLLRGNKKKLLRKQRFLKKILTVTLKSLFKKRRLYKRSLRKTNRFFRWKIKKTTSFFTRCLRIKKVRKLQIKAITSTSPIHSRVNKYGSFNTAIKYPYPNYINQTNLNGVINTMNLDSGAFKTGLLSYNVLQPIAVSHEQSTLFIMTNPLLLKSLIFSYKGLDNGDRIRKIFHDWTSKSHYSNLNPHSAFNKRFSKKVLNSFANRRFREDIIPMYQNTLVRFIEFCTGKKALFQFYPFVNQHIDKSYMVRYKRWLPRMNFYERRLGHRFFLEESLHIIHISFILRDPKIIASWLKAMILRISFWKTRSIFRFLKYLFHNYFIHVFDDIKVKGLKIRLKGKISAAGNSRKRTILYRIGNTSHSEVNLRVVKDFSLINTFTGVMGFQVYLFY